MRAIHAVLGACLLGLCAPAGAGPIRDRIYPAPTAPLTLAGLPTGSEMVTVRTADGLMLSGIASPCRPGMPTLLLFHGNGSSAAVTVDWFAPLIAAGYGVIAAEYRGYSTNPGRPDEAGLAADADAFYALARSRSNGGKLWVVGHSLGGGVAFGLARRRHLDALVTIGAFTRLRAMAPGLARAFVPDGYDNKAAIATLDEPYFLIHGARDDIVPWQQGEALHDAAGAAHKPGASFVVLDAGHHPGADTLLAIFAAIRLDLETGDFGITALPAPIKLVPFGQSKPLNP